MDVKKSVIIAIGIIVVAAAVLAVAAVAFNLINGNLPGEPTPGPSGSVTPAPDATAAVTPTAKPGTPGSAPVYVGAILNRTSGMCLVTIMLNKDAVPVDASRLTMSIECDGQTYRNVWSPSPFDWAGSDGDTRLEFGEVLSPIVETSRFGIPQERPITIKILQDTTELQQTTVSPT